MLHSSHAPYQMLAITLACLGLAGITVGLACSTGCAELQKSCTAIHVADNACHALVLRDGTSVVVTESDLETAARAALARDAGADVR